MRETPVDRRIVITQGCRDGLRKALAPEIRKKHEGVVYFGGLTNGTTTALLTLLRPDAETTYGSFDVGTLAMARVVRAAADRGLQVVGQLHTHPVEAFHSHGDEEGARIRYDGYTSIVVPDYGRVLPDLADAAYFMFSRRDGFVVLQAEAVAVVPGRIL